MIENTAIPPKVKEEIIKLYQKGQNNPLTYDELEKLVIFAIENYQNPLNINSNKPIKVNEIKQAIYKRFNVRNTDELKKSVQFKMATDGMDKLNLNKKETWEMFYRKWIDILPNEIDEEVYGCINGIDIFKYFRPWQVFNLDSKTATSDDIKTAFRQLSKIYHPDNQETGDRKIFERLTQMYDSLIAAIPKKS